MIDEAKWQEAQKFEAKFWGNCVNTHQEEVKQLEAADRMGLQAENNGNYVWIDAKDKCILDIGGGVCSLLLKCKNLKCGIVVDPLPMPSWVRSRYGEAGIALNAIPAEEYKLEGEKRWDEVWIYNVLQHVKDPKKVIEVAKGSADLIRIFEWVGVEPYHGHPHTLQPPELDEWLGGRGKVEKIKDIPAYFGVFPIHGDNTKK